MRAILRSYFVLDQSQPGTVNRADDEPAFCRKQYCVVFLTTPDIFWPGKHRLHMNTKQPLRDRSSRTIGYIITHPDGKQHLEDVTGHTLGYYDPKQDKTEDRNHRTVGYGNLLATLIR